MYKDYVLYINFMIFMQDMNDSTKQEEILQSTTDAAEWNLEVERVLPQLKVTVRTDNKVCERGVLCVHMGIKVCFESAVLLTYHLCFCFFFSSFVMPRIGSNGLSNVISVYLFSGNFLNG